MKLKRNRILYIQKFPGGGSMISLCHLIRGLDKSRFTPVILLYSSHYKEELEDLGAKVVLLEQMIDFGKERSTVVLPRHENIQPTQSLKRSKRPFPDLRRLIRRDWPLARQVARVIRAERIDLVHHNSSIESNRDSIIGARLAGVPQVCHVRGLSDYQEGSFSYRLDRFYLSKSNISSTYRRLLSASISISVSQKRRGK